MLSVIPPKGCYIFSIPLCLHYAPKVNKKFDGTSYPLEYFTTK